MPSSARPDNQGGRIGKPARLHSWPFRTRCCNISCHRKLNNYRLSARTSLFRSYGFLLTFFVSWMRPGGLPVALRFWRSLARQV
jgi:hypothetical protein